MNISEIAKNYAEGKALESITNAIAQAYEDGYRQGYKDRDSEIPVNMNENNDKTKYVDLGLPSGTLWAEDCLRDEETNDYCYLPHCKANELALPTLEHWLELNEMCEKRRTQDGWCFIGPNGNYIVFKKMGYYSGDMYEKSSLSTHFWLNGTVSARNQAPTVFIDDRNNFMKMTQWTGDRRPVRLVKTK